MIRLRFDGNARSLPQDGIVHAVIFVELVHGLNVHLGHVPLGYRRQRLILEERILKSLQGFVEKED